MNRKTRPRRTPLSLDACKKRIADLEKEMVLAREQIKEQKRAITFLSEERRRTKECCDNTPIMICHLSLSGKILDVNQTLVNRLGVQDRTRLISRSAFTGIFSPSCRSRARQLFKALRKTRTLHNQELLVRHADGKDIDVLVNATAMRDKKGRPDSVHCNLVDISESKQTADRLANASRIIAQSPAVAFIWKNARDWPVEYVSPNVKTVLGYTVADFEQGKIRYADIVHTDDLKRVSGEVEKYSLKKRCHHFNHQPYRICRADGKHIWLDDRTTIIRDRQGRITHYQGIIINISNSVARDSALRRSEEIYRSLVDKSPDIVYMFSTERGGLFYSDRVKDVFGISAQAMTKKPFLWADAVHPDDRQTVRDIVKASLKGRPFSVEYRVKGAGGVWRWLLDRSIRMYSQGDETIIEGLASDITDRKSAEQALRNSETKYRSIIEGSIDGFCICDTQDRILEANDSLGAMLGYTKQEMDRLRINEIEGIESPAQIRMHMQKVISRRKDSFTTKLKRKNGGFIDVMVSGRFDPDTGHIYSFIRDISGLKSVERKLARERDRAQQYLDIAGTMFVAIDTRGKVTMVNRKTCEVLGYGEDAIIGKSWFANFLPRRVRREVRSLSRSILKENAADWEYVESYVLCKDGSERVIGWYNSVLRDDAGKVVGHLSSGHDITGRKEMERALASSESRYRALMEGSGLGIEFYSAKGEILMMNRAACERISLPVNKVIGKRVGDVFGNDMGRLVRKRIRTALRDTDGGMYEDCVALRGGECWYRSLYRAIREGRGKLLGVQLISEDITAIKRAEDAIRDLARFPEENPSPVLRLKSDGSVLYANKGGQAFKKALANGKGSVDGKYLDILTKALSSKKTRGMDVAVGDKLYSAVFAPVPETGYVNIYAQDITERKRMEQERLAAAVVWQETFDAMNAGIFFISAAGIILKANHAMARMLDKSIDEIVGEPCYKVIHGRQTAAPDCYLKRLQKKRTHYNAVWEWHGRWVQVEADPVTDPDGRLIGAVHIMTDITEQTRDRKNLERYRQAVEASFDMVLVISPERKILTVNSALLRFFKEKRKKMADLNLRKLFGRRLYDEHIGPKIGEALQGKIVSDEKDLTFEGHGKRVFMFRYYPFRNTENVVEGVALSISDVTDRRFVERELAVSERKFRSIIEYAGLGIIVIKPDGTLINANPAFCGMTGWKADDLVGTTQPYPFWAHDVQSELLERYELLLFRGNMEFESRFRHFEGREFPVRIVASPILDNRNKAVAFIQIVQNISEQYRMLERLQESERRYRLLVEDMPAMVCRLTYDGDLTFANKAFTGFYGITEREMVGRHWLEFVPEDKRKSVVDRYSRLSEGTPMLVSENTIRDTHGLYRWYQWIDRLLVDKNGKPREYQSLGIDITDRKAAEQRLQVMSLELRKLTEHLQHAREEERAHLARELHDELGQQLTALKMDISYIQKKCDPHHNERIVNKLTDMQDLVQNAISTVKQMSLDLRPGVLDDLGIPAALEWLVDDFRKRSELDCGITVQADIPSVSREISVALFRVLQEALTNIARHARASRVRVTLVMQDDLLVMDIRDDGGGIPDDKLESSGSFGLIGMRERIVALHGLVWITSPPEGGTLVRICVPFREGDPAPEETEPSDD